MKNHTVAVLAGDGIGPEIMAAAGNVLDAVEASYNVTFRREAAVVGGAAIDAVGEALPEETVRVCRESDAVLFGAVGGPQWESLPPEKQPERAALLPLRKTFGLFANLRPAVIFPELRHASPLKPEIIGDSLDVLVVRELTGGIYFGTPKGKDRDRGFDTMVYTRAEIERIAHVAFQAARRRQKKVTSIDKANVLSTMVLWREVVSEVAREYPEITVNHMYVDNAAMQLVRNPHQFDVMLCGNMFGDILSDEASMITGSLGMLPSASLSVPKDDGTGFGLYEPAGGSAPDIAGQDVANPIAQILSAAMMVKFSFGMDDAHDGVFAAVSRVLKQGYRTRDIASGGDTVIGTAEMGRRIAEEVSQR
jgi:3-isopropylmalate dehydrogenase